MSYVWALDQLGWVLEVDGQVIAVVRPSGDKTSPAAWRIFFLNRIRAYGAAKSPAAARKEVDETIRVFWPEYSDRW